MEKSTPWNTPYFFCFFIKCTYTTMSYSRLLNIARLLYNWNKEQKQQYDTFASDNHVKVQFSYLKIILNALNSS